MGGFAATIRGDPCLRGFSFKSRIYGLGISQPRNCYPDGRFPLISVAHHTIAKDHLCQHDGRQTSDDRLYAVYMHSDSVEYRELTNNAPEGILAGTCTTILPQLANALLTMLGPVDESNFFEWECYISGPEGTPFEGGIFPATLSFPKVPHSI